MPPRKKLRRINTLPSRPVKYIERKCADAEEVCKKLCDGTNVLFLGPKGCGKSTTLVHIAKKMKDDGHLTFFIDMGLLEKNIVDSYQEMQGSYVFVDNAQYLATMWDSEQVRKMKGIISRQCAVCYVFSPTIRNKARGSTIHSVDIRAPKKIFYFTPFEKDELQRYIEEVGVGKSHSADDMVSRIPAIVASVLSGDAKGGRVQLISLFAHIMRKIKEERACEVAHALFKLVVYGTINISEVSSVELVESGLCYYDSDYKVHLAYPDNIVLQSLQKDMENWIALFADFAKRTALEFKFRVMAYKGFIAVTLDQNAINIPPADKFLFQSKRGEVLPSAEGECVLIKLSENHVAVDFLILDATEIGVSSKKLFFVQVSAMKYQDSPKGRKFDAVHAPSLHTNGETPWDYYTSRLSAEKSYYVYASPAESSFHKDREHVYLIDLSTIQY